MRDPDISVVIATRNRETRLRFALESLLAQTLDRERFEVVVVRADDSVGPFTEAPDGLPVTFLEAPAGPARQRNAGWRQARGRLIAFTDDDCRCSPEWLGAVLESATGRTVIQGPTLPDPNEEHLLHGRARSIEIDSIDVWYPTCNIVYPREVLEGIGGFDETFPTAWCEDTDLGLRAAAAGAELRFEPGALVYHAVNARTLRQAVREALRRDSLPMLLARHPEQRHELFMSTFARRTHARFVLALAGLLLLRRSVPIGVAAMYPYLANRRKPHEVIRDLPKIAARLPARAAVDGAEVYAVAKAAIRHRVPVI